MRVLGKGEGGPGGGENLSCKKGFPLPPAFVPAASRHIRESAYVGSCRKDLLSVIYLVHGIIMLREVLKYPDRRLAEKSVAVAEVTPEIRQLAEDMLETMYANDGIGLAAPQVGELIRLVVIDISGPEQRSEPMALVNPTLELDGEEVESEEGCLSVEEYRSQVKRASRVRLKAADLEGNPVELEAEGTLAVCLQHECDHLDGVLFIDRISRLKRSLYASKVKKWQKRER